MALRVPPARVFDVALALAVAAGGSVEVWLPLESRQGDGSPVASTVTVLVMATALIFRRAHPLAAAVVALGTLAAAWVVAPTYVLFWGGFVPFLVAVYSVARYGRGHAPFAGAAVGAATLLLADLTVDVLQSPSEIVFHWSVGTLTWSAGYALQVKERRAEISLQRAVDAEVTAAAQVLTAVIDERTRIARELHDVVAHAVSTMVVQAGAAGQVVDDDPAFVRRALDTIRETGSEALDEMRRVVAMLREDGEAGALAPQPGVARLPALVADSRSADLDVTLTTEGTARELPAGLDLAVFRIVQEALTNVRRHAAASRAEVRLRYAEDLLDVEVVDDGRGPVRRPSNPTGHGLVGMQERVALYGGRLETGSVNGSGFRVHAELPVAR